MFTEDDDLVFVWQGTERLLSVLKRSRVHGDDGVGHPVADRPRDAGPDRATVAGGWTGSSD